MSAPIGFGPVGARVLRYVADHVPSTPQILRLIKDQASGPNADSLIANMAQQGLIVRSRNRWHITAAGIDRLPRALNIAPMVPYVPPKAPPRRPGSGDFRNLPSIAAGVARTWRHPT